MPVLSLGDLVWVDEDADGVYDPLTENPLPGVTVSLTDTNGDAVFDANGDPIADVETDADGRYFFTNLDPGTYVVTFTLPDGYIWTPADAGTDGVVRPDHARPRRPRRPDGQRSGRSRRHQPDDRRRRRAAPVDR
jgi:SdrD B-like domain